MNDSPKMTNLSENSLPAGKYTFVGVDIDTTGRRILDEIVHLVAYTPKSSYEQYVIPVMNLNPAARQRHQLRIITVGFFRMLKCVVTNKVLKSKTEIKALRSFLEWLEERKADDTGSNGVVLVYHEPIKFIPFMLLEAFKKYDLMDRFLSVCVAFVDGHAMSTAECAVTTKYQSMRHLAKMLIDVGEENDPCNFEGNAAVRARLGYQIVQQLARDQLDDPGAEITADAVKGFIHSVKCDINELSEQNKCMDLQHSFRAVFVDYFKANLFYRYKAVTYRRVLAEKGYGLESLQTIWNEKQKDGLTEIINGLEDIKEENREELINILDSFFDPEKEQIVPVAKKSSFDSQRRRSFRKDKSHRGGDNGERDGDQRNDGLSTPDSTVRSPRKRRPRRRDGNRRHSNKDGKSNTHSQSTNIPVGTK